MASSPDERDEEHGSLDEGPDDHDRDAPNASIDLVTCPHCAKSLWEQAERCHHCGRYVIEAESRSQIPIWIWIGIILCLLMAVIWALFPQNLK